MATSTRTMVLRPMRVAWAWFWVQVLRWMCQRWSRTKVVMMAVLMGTRMAVTRQGNMRARVVLAVN